MPLKTLANSRTRVNVVGAGAECRPFAILYTVPANTKALVKDIRIAGENSAGGAMQFTIYVLKSGDVDLTLAASNSTVQERAFAEAKNPIPITAQTPSANSFSQQTSTDIVLEGGDSIRAWLQKNAVTLNDTDLWALISGVEV